MRSEKKETERAADTQKPDASPTLLHFKPNSMQFLVILFFRSCLTCSRQPKFRPLLFVGHFSGRRRSPPQVNGNRAPIAAAAASEN